ncbi:MAG: hypothetical protein ACXVXL_22005 [Solirubrobacteraceae bacterium]
MPRDLIPIARRLVVTAALVAAAVALELGSRVSFVVVIRLFFDRVPAATARELDWTEQGSGALLAGGGVGAPPHARRPGSTRRAPGGRPDSARGGRDRGSAAGAHRRPKPWLDQRAATSCTLPIDPTEVTDMTTKTPSTPRLSDRAAIARPLVLALAVLFAMTSIYVEAFHAPGPRSVPIAVVTTPSGAARVQRALDRSAPGAFEVRGLDTEAQARNAVAHAEVRGALMPGAGRDRAFVARAFGVSDTLSTTAALQSLAAHAHVPLSVTDVVPLPAQDRFGLSSLFTVVGTLLPSLAFGIGLAFAAAGLAWRRRWSAILLYGVLAGVVIALTVDELVGALTASFAGLALVGGLLALAVASVAHGTVRLAGPPGALIALAVLMILGLPASGGAVTHELQPGFFDAVSQWLPPGAALTAIRNIQYFHWAGTLQPLLTLAGWALLGLALGVVGDRFGAAARATSRLRASRARARSGGQVVRLIGIVPWRT